MKSILYTSTIVFLFAIRLDAQNEVTFSFISGNAYNHEIKVAEQVFNCIEEKCINGLKRSGFMHDSVQYEQNRIFDLMDSLREFVHLGYSFRLKKFRPDTTLPQLTFYKTYAYKDTEEPIAQLKIRLAYDRGLLTLVELAVLEDHFISFPEKQLIYKFNEAVPTNNNIPFPPPPPRPEVEQIYKIRGLNLCGGCHRMNTMTSSNELFLWLKEKKNYERFSRITKELIKVKKGDYYGIINRDDEPILPLIYDKIWPRSNEYFEVYRVNKMGIFDFDGNEIIPPKYEKIRMVMVNGYRKNPMYIVQEDNDFGVLDKEGFPIIPSEFDAIDLFYSQFFRVKKGKYYGLFSLRGDQILDVNYRKIEYGGIPSFFTISTTSEQKGKEKIILIEKEDSYRIKEVKN